MLLDGRVGVRIPTGARDSSSPKRLWDPPSHPFTECQGYFLGIKRPGHEGNDLFASSDDVKDKWSYTSTARVCLHDMDRDSCTLCTVGLNMLYTHTHAHTHTHIYIYIYIHRISRPIRRPGP